jgi:hypothetical protein
MIRRKDTSSEMTTTVKILMDSLSNVIAIPEKQLYNKRRSFCYVLENENLLRKDYNRNEKQITYSGFGG